MVGEASIRRRPAFSDNDVESVIRAILGREELGSTGIGQGVAVCRTHGHPTLHRPDRYGGPVTPRCRFRRRWTVSRSTSSSSCWSRPRIKPGDHLRALGEYFPTPEGLNGFLVAFFAAQAQSARECSSSFWRKPTRGSLWEGAARLALAGSPARQTISRSGPRRFSTASRQYPEPGPGSNSFIIPKRQRCRRMNG